MKFNSYTFSLLFIALTVAAIHAIEDKEHDILFEENNTQMAGVDIQAQMNAVFNNMYEIIMPDYKVIYKKYWNEIEWLEHYYVLNREEGNIILNIIAIEFQNVIIDKFDSFFDILVTQTHSKPSAQEREAFKSVMMQMLPLMVTQGLMKNAELKSSVYQELMAEQKN